MRELTYSQPLPRRVRKTRGVVARDRAKRKRADDKERLAVRAACVLRDGYCKVAILGDCSGPSQHAHLGRFKRGRTRMMAPTERHTMQGSAMLCAKHHVEEERGRLQLAMVADLGANGPVRVAYRDQVYMING